MLSTPPKHRLRRPQNLLAACLFAAAFPLATSAQARTFIGGDNSSFGTATNWNPNGVPGAAANDVLTVSDSSVSGLSGDLHVTINGLFGTSNTISSLTFDSVALPQSLVLTQTGGTIQTTTETLGNIAFGNTYNQGSGSANIAATFNMGVTSGSIDNFYNLNDAGTSLTVTSNLNVGIGGVAVFTQTNGTVSVHNPSNGGAFLTLAGNSSSSGTYTFSGGTLTVDDFSVAAAGNGVFNQSGGTLTVNVNTFLTANGGFTATYNYSGGSATFGTGLAVGNRGIFNLKTGGALPFNVAVASGGTFNFAGGSFGTGNATVNSGGTFNLASGSFNAGTVTVNSGGIFNFIGGTFGNGNVSLNSGTLQLQGHNLTFSSHIQGTGTIQNGSSSTNSTFTFASTGSFAGIIADGSTATMSVSLTSGTFILSGSNTYSGGTTVPFGTILKPGKANALSSNSTINLATGGTLDLNGFDQTVGGLIGSTGGVSIGAASLTIANSADDSFTSVVAGSGTLTKSSTGTLTLSDIFSFTGAINVTGGTLALSNDINATAYSATSGGTLQIAFPLTVASGTMNATGGTITFTSSNSPTIGDTSGSPATVTIGAAGTFTTGTGTTAINATGTINLTGGAFNANGGISVTGGSFSQTSGTFTWAANQTMTIQSVGTVSFASAYSTPTNAIINVSGTGSKLTFTGSTATFSIINGALLSITSGASATIHLLSVGSTGTGTVLVDGTNSALTAQAVQPNLGEGGTGTLTFSHNATGTLLGIVIGPFNSTAGNGTLNVQSGATLTTTAAIDVALGSAAGSAAVNLTGGTLTQSGSSTIRIGAPSTSTGAFTVGTSGIYNTGTGNITINATGTLTLQSGGTLNVNGPVTNSGTVALAGTQSWATGTSFTNNAGTATFTTDPGTASVAHLALSINGGTVLLTGNQHLASLTLSGGTLGGYATITAPVTLGSSALTIAPSATLSSTSLGSLQLNNLTTNAHTTLAFNLKTPNLLTGGSDQIVIGSFQGLNLSGGTIAITGTSTGVASLGYYKAILYISTLQGTGITSITMPPIANNIAYTLDTQHDPGFVDIHRGYLGDANDDGIVNIDDYLRIDAAFLLQTPNPTWSSGDFNADGTVNFKDYALIDFAAQHPTGVLADSTLAADEITLHTAEFGAAYTDALAALNTAPIPEPASLTLLLTFLPALLTRRRPGPKLSATSTITTTLSNI